MPPSGDSVSSRFPTGRRPHRLALVVLVTGLLGAGGTRKGPGKLRPARPAKSMKDPSIPVSAIQALQEGQLARAWRFANNHLERQPRGRAGYAVLGGIESRMGWATEAIEVFDAGVGARWYGGIGHILHANALRATGHGAKAAAMREDDLRDEREGVRLRTWTAIVDDHRATGDLPAAEDALANGFASYPRSSVLMSAAADLAIDRGDIAEAEAWLALIQHYAGPVRRTRHVNLRIAVLENDFGRADTIATGLLRVEPGDPLAIAALAHSLTARGQPGEALTLLRSQEAHRRGDATLLTAEARALASLGETRAARELVSFILDRHPHDIDARTVEASLTP